MKTPLLLTVLFAHSRANEVLCHRANDSFLTTKAHVVKAQRAS